MKKLGGILISALVLVLTGFVIFSVGTASLGTNKNNVAKNITLSIEEARELVGKVYAASKGSSSVSTAAAYDKEYVEEVSFDSYFEAANEILQLTNDTNGKIQYHNSWGQNFFSYELTQNGIKFEFFGDEDRYDKDDGKIGAVSIIDCHYDNSNKDTWSVTGIRLRGDDCVYITDETATDFNKYFEWIEASGIDNKTQKADVKIICVNQSFFGTEQLTKDNLDGAWDRFYDSINHEQNFKSWGVFFDEESETLTDNEANQLVANVQNQVKAIFAGKTFSRDGYITVSK